MKKYNLVFEGGGVKGIGLVGAVYALEKAGVGFGGLAGTSAGAIVAALLAAGFNAGEMKEILCSTDYLKFKQKTLLDHFGLPGMSLSIFFKYGVYSADYFESWLEGILSAKNVKVFGDIKNNGGAGKYKFRAVASDITSKRLLILPDDLIRFGIDIDDFSIAKAVRMSMSIPVFFEPYRLTDKLSRVHIIVDGGILSNYPVWLFDNVSGDTLSLRFMECKDTECPATETNEINSFADYIKCIVDTMLDAHDKRHIKFGKGDYRRTAFISPVINEKGKRRLIKSTHFDLSEMQVKALFENGKSAGEALVGRIY